MLPLRNQTLIIRIRYKLECPRHILPFDRSTNDGRIRKTNNSHSLLFSPGNEYFQITFSSSFFFSSLFLSTFFPLLSNQIFFSKKKKSHPSFHFRFYTKQSTEHLFPKKKTALIFAWLNLLNKHERRPRLEHPGTPGGLLLYREWCDGNPW